MIKVEFYKLDKVADELLKYAVIATVDKGNWIFVRHRDRMTWEIPGGRREPNEKILKTAERELVEETGASQFSMKAICVYSVTIKSEKSYGLLAYAEVDEFEKALTLEIGEREAFSELPTDLTYPLIQPKLLEFVENVLKQKLYSNKDDI